MRKRFQAALALACVWVASCSGTGKIESVSAPPVNSRSPLSATEWRLLEIQSMDDSIGVKRPDDPGKYTLRLNADGTARLKLNCNSATGTWTSSPASEGNSGKFEFGPLAATQALCPPPSLDKEISGQAKSVRSYLLKDGRLYLSLMADGGIYAWEPLSGGSAAKGDPELEAAILAASPGYESRVVDQSGGAGRSRYAVAEADLNGDGADEVFVYTMGSFFCGTGGCNLLLFTRGPEGYRLVNSFPITRLPVVIAESSSDGWKDLWKLESGGGAPASYVREGFNGKKYVERERVPADNAPSGRAVFAGDIKFDSGIPLAPRK